MITNSFYETVHKATKSFPYLDFKMENINYLSHFHEEIELIHVLSGCVNISIENKNYTMNCGDIGIILPGEIHSFSTETNNKLYIIKIVEPHNEEQINLSQIKLIDHILTSQHKNYQTIINIISDMYKESKEKNFGYSVAVNKLSLEIVLFILRNLKHETISIEERKALKNRLSFLNIVTNYIENNYKESISLSDISNHCGYSTYYFSHYFKETTNTSFNKFLTFYRLKKAIDLISVTGNKLTDIAYSCGFNNIRSFNRTFKQYTNKTPTEYKNNIK